MESRRAVFTHLIEAASSTKEKLFLSAVWLFSSQGYDRVGIRELSASIGIKESSFYNHYPSKQALLDAVFEHWTQGNAATVLSPAELEAWSQGRDPLAFLLWSMERFREHTDTPVFHAVLNIIKMESYTNQAARQRALFNMYHVRKDSTLAVLKRMQAAGALAPVDLEAWASAFLYGLIGLLDEYLLLELDAAELGPILGRLRDHLGFFAGLLQAGGPMNAKAHSGGDTGKRSKE